MLQEVLKRISNTETLLSAEGTCYLRVTLRKELGWLKVLFNIIYFP